jgi:hypothetical protein
MLITPPHIARYWVCGGEIHGLGGPLRLRPADGRPSPGCRLLSLRQLADLRDWHAAEAQAASESADNEAAALYHRLCLRDADHALAQFRSVPAAFC